MRRSALALLLLALAASPAMAQDGDPSSTDAASADVAEGEAVPAAPAHRSSTIFTPSLLLSYGGGRSADFGVGANMALAFYPTEWPLRFGGFVQGEVLADSTVRVAGGMQTGLWLFDCQMGVAYRSATDRFAGSLGLQIGKTIDFGWISVGARVTIPLVDFVSPNSAQQTQGVEGALVITVGWPTALDGEARDPFDCPRSHMRGGTRCPCEHGEEAASDASTTPDAPAADEATAPS
jgi:hypothetical protein